MKESQERFLTAFANCGRVQQASRWAQVDREAHYRWLECDTYSERFAKAMRAVNRVLEDQAVRMAIEGLPELVLHNGKPVKVNGTLLYKYTVDSKLDCFRA